MRWSLDHVISMGWVMNVFEKIYKNHEGLDESYMEIVKRHPDINQYLEQIEVCDRNGNLTLALWLSANDYVKNEVVRTILEVFSDVVTYQQCKVLHERMQDNQASDLIIVNPDKFKSILRYYYRDDLNPENKYDSLRGEDIAINGAIVKTKMYGMVHEADAMGKICTQHNYSDGDSKTTYASLDRSQKCKYIIRREDGQTYYLYKEA